LLLPFFQTVPGSLLFVLRPVYVIVLLVMIFGVYNSLVYARRTL